MMHCGDMGKYGDMRGKQGKTGKTSDKRCKGSCAGNLAFRYVRSENGKLRGTGARGKRMTRGVMCKRQDKRKGGD